MQTADQIIASLELAPHPEGGWYRQTWVGPQIGPQIGPLAGQAAPRASGTAIYFLLKAGERSHWHRVDADEIWLFHAGAPLLLSLAATAAGPAQEVLLGPDLTQGHAPQRIAPAGWWQAAATSGDWTLVSCTVSPGFRFEGFELAAPGFDIPREG